MKHELWEKTLMAWLLAFVLMIVISVVFVLGYFLCRFFPDFTTGVGAR